MTNRTGQALQRRLKQRSTKIHFETIRFEMTTVIESFERGDLF